MIVSNLQSIVDNNKTVVSPLYLRNLLKESLQFYVLNYIYSSKYGEDFLFKGGTCLRFCFGLPRLSEDLDIDVKNYSTFDINAFLDDLRSYFIKGLQYKTLRTRIAGNGKQVYLKFPILNQLGLKTNPSESDVLLLRLDISPVDSSIFKEEISLKTTYDFSFIMKRYSLSDLFASKLAAILQRSYKKGRADLITFKGRDYFDLIWFLEKGISPDFERLKDITKIKSRSEILKSLDEKVKKVKENYLKEDLLPLFKDEKFVNKFVENFKTLYRGKRELLCRAKI